MEVIDFTAGIEQDSLEIQNATTTRSNSFVIETRVDVNSSSLQRDSLVSVQLEPIAAGLSARQPVTLEFDQLTFSTAGKQILKEVSGIALSGHLLAIMGPSGAGKTTLLDTLAGRLPYAKTNSLTGSLRVNGKERDLPTFRQTSAYVLQSDYFFPEMTVKETITLSAMLRLPSEMPKHKKMERVDQIIRELGLVKCQETYVGNELIRGVSGGERKRVNIGTELVTDPSLIFLDEPTSGLDSFSAESVMSSLLKLAKNNRTIITTIHQPRSSIYAMFDNLLLLSEGRGMYYGPAKDAVGYFGSLGYNCPATFNPSDYFLDVLSLDARDPTTEKTTRARLDVFALEYTETLDRVRAAGRLSIAGSSVARAADSLDKTSADNIHPRKFATGFFTQLMELSRRCFINISRQDQNNIAVLSQTIIFALLLGFIWLRTDDNKSGVTVQSITGLLFFILINQAFGGGFGVVFTFPAERAVVLKERASKTYRLSAYFISKIVSDLPRVALSALLFAILTYFMTGLRSGAGHFFAFFIILVLTQLCAEGIAYSVSAGVKNAQMAGAIFPVFMVTTVLFGGFFLGTDNIPIWLRWIKYISFIKYAYAAVVQNEYTDHVLDLSACSSTFCPKDGNDVLDFYGLDELPFYANILLLIAMMLTIWTIAYTVLLRNGPKFDRSL